MSHLPPIVTEERFGRFPTNIPIKSPSPDKYGSNIIAPTLSPSSMNINRVITPVKNSKKYFSNESAGKEASTGNGKITNNSFANVEAHTNRQSRLISESVDYRLVQSREIHTNVNQSHYVKLLKEKEEIIVQLKNIIKMINENNSKSRILYQTHAIERQGLQNEGTQIEQLRHKVKVLTIQNNKLIDIIDRLKLSTGVTNTNQIISSTDRNTTPNKITSSRAEGRIQDLRNQLSDVRRLLREKENQYQKEIDELIKSHKSLAIQCIKHQTQKKLIEKQNQKLIKLLKQKDESERKLFNEKYDKMRQQDDRTFRSQGSERALTLIRQQYLESLKQFKETMTMEAENIFQTIQAGLQDLNDKVQVMQSKLIQIENFVQTKMKEISSHLKKKADKKSEIYIEESVSSSISSNQIEKQKSLQEKNDHGSRLIDQLSFSRKSNEGNEDVSALHQEIQRLMKELKDKQQSLKHYIQENEYLRTSSIARQNSIDKIKNESSKKQNQMISEINLLRNEIDKLQVSYRQEKQQITQRFESQMISYSQKYQQQIEELRMIKETFKGSKFTYTPNWAIIQKLKQQINLLKDKNQRNQSYNTSLQQQNQDLAKANHQLGKMIEAKANEVVQISKLMKTASTKLDYTERCNQEILKKLKQYEDQIKIKEKELTLTNQKNQQLTLQKSALEKQIIEYLSLFNKFNRTDNTMKTNLESSDSAYLNLINNVTQIEREFDRFQKHHAEIEGKILHVIQESKSIVKQPSIIDQL